MRKGQYIRLLLSTAANPTKVVAAAKEMQLHLSAQTEDSSTKDSTGDFLEYEVTGQSYDISGSALVLSPDDKLGGSTANTLTDMINGLTDNLLYWKICIMEGDNNRTVVEELFSGTAKLTSLQIQGQNKQNATYSYTLNGYDTINVAQKS
ncbi:MAG: hypothetical protein J1E37_06100 [Prevotella sp.]|nr:hypothetical protein [Prevotella sp.]